MRNIFRKHYKKIIFFGIFKKFLILYFLFYCSSVFASGTYSNVYFTDYEENSTIYFCNYYSYIDIKNVINDSRTTDNIISARQDALFTSISQIDDVSGVGSNTLSRLRQQGHIINWDIYTNDFGLTLIQMNFLYALTASLLGFTFTFFFIFILVTRGL